MIGVSRWDFGTERSFGLANAPNRHVTGPPTARSTMPVAGRPRPRTPPSIVGLDEQAVRHRFESGRPSVRMMPARHVMSGRDTTGHVSRREDRRPDAGHEGERSDGPS